MSTKNSNKRKVIIGVSIVLIALLLISIPLFTGKNKEKYLSTEVTTGTIENFRTFSGSVASENTKILLAEKNVEISEIKVLEGDKVKKDDILIKFTNGTNLKANIDATVNKIFVEDDEKVSPGAQLAELIDMTNFIVDIKVDENNLSSVSLNKEVNVSIESLNREIAGKITDVSRTAVNQNGIAYFTARIKLVYDSELKVGMSAETKILDSKAQDVLIIPVKALAFDEEEQPYVLIANDKGEKNKLIVKIGLNDGKNVEIIEGLNLGDTVYFTDETAQANKSFGPPKEVKERGQTQWREY